MLSQLFSLLGGFINLISNIWFIPLVTGILTVWVLCYTRWKCYISNAQGFSLVPSGVSSEYLKFFIVFLEVITHLIRPLTLSLRIIANAFVGQLLVYGVYSSACVYAFFQPAVIIFAGAVLLYELAILFIQCSVYVCLLYTSPSPRDAHESRMPSSA